MKVLVIPDVHLKPYMFTEASTLMNRGVADIAVCLMDIADDWNQEKNIALYEESYDAAIEFAKEFPTTKFCYGNHDLSYKWHELETGYSFDAAYIVQKKMVDLMSVLPEDNPISYVQRIDNVLFSHAGLSDFFVEEKVSNSKNKNIDKVIEEVNKMGKNQMWYDPSPIWARPQRGSMKMYKPRKLLQVVGHTPVDAITQNGNIISCDTFSTYKDGKPIGTQEFLLIDTLSWEYRGIS